MGFGCTGTMRAEGMRHAGNDTGLQPVNLVADLTYGDAIGYYQTGRWPVEEIHAAAADFENKNEIRT
jgi:hypothetical protein